MRKKKLKIAIISGPENGSPRVLAYTLNSFIHFLGEYSYVFLKAKAIRRLHARLPGYNTWVWLLYKFIHFIEDKVFFIKIKKYDAVIICDWTPNGFYRESYNIQKLKKIIRNKPVMYYAVQFLGNSPTQIQYLKKGGHPLIERYDWHLSVSDVTEIRQQPSPPWSRIGLYMKSSGLMPVPKKEFIAVVDFEREGYERYREEQIRVLEELNIKYITLEGSYEIDEIREIYRQASIYFIESSEAFGMPIAECLACGSYVCVPDSSWPMAWRLDKDPEVHGPGKLPECFIVYDGGRDLKKQLNVLLDNYDLKKTPNKVFNIFLKYYAPFYEGDSASLLNVFEMIKNKKI